MGREEFDWRGFLLLGNEEDELAVQARGTRSWDRRYQNEELHALTSGGMRKKSFGRSALISWQEVKKRGRRLKEVPCGVGKEELRYRSKER